MRKVTEREEPETVLMGEQAAEQAEDLETGQAEERIVERTAEPAVE